MIFRQQTLLFKRKMVKKLLPWGYADNQIAKKYGVDSDHLVFNGKQLLVRMKLGHV
ncbi:MAG: hypothetical protein K2O03_08285 [Lachnospiraceae bacterium]|nr:hypothetical protein [Lachnospiraceae bacterium]